METGRDGVAVAPHGLLPRSIGPIARTGATAHTRTTALKLTGGATVPLEGPVPTGAVAQASIGGAPRVLA